MGFAMEQIIYDRDYPGWIHTPYQKAVDFEDPVYGDQGQVKATLNPMIDV
jgi:hypothetical protein